MGLLNEAPIWPDGDSLPPQWQYCVVAAIGINPLANISMQLDDYGRQGWELICFDGRTFVFKRPNIEVPDKPPVRHAERVAVEA